MSLQQRNKVDPSFNMSSLADIIFLLLIFFLLTSKLVPDATPVKRPSSTMNSKVSPVARITVKKNKQYFVDGKEVGYNGLTNALKPKLAKEDKPVVLLDMDRSLDIQTMVDLYDLAGTLKFELVLAVESKK